ncbi:MAG: hypothetical protein IKO36_00875 [Bacteroidaceae bacterium]|nr:hypothetical protein [Bacteroidaceae bacterium]
MKNMWNSSDKTELNMYIEKVGKLYNKYKFIKADEETLFKIRNETLLGLWDSYHVLKMYLETQGMTINKNTKEITKMLNRKELYKLFEDIIPIIDNKDDYYTSYSASIDYKYGPDDKYISFEVHCSSSKSGNNWTETWCINNDGTISNENETYKSINEFKLNW